jgi:hypothetical protein
MDQVDKLLSAFRKRVDPEDLLKNYSDEEYLEKRTKLPGENEHVDVVELEKLFKDSLSFYNMKIEELVEENEAEVEGKDEQTKKDQ